MRIFKIGDFYHYESSAFHGQVHPARIGFRAMNDSTIRVSIDSVGQASKLEVVEYFLPNEILDRFNNPYGTTFDEVMIGLNTGFDVNISDQTTPAVIAPFNRVLNSTALTNPVSIGDYQATLDSVVGATSTPGLNYMVMFDASSARFSQFNITNIVGNVVTLDRPIDFAYPAGVFVDVGRTNMGGEVGTIASPIVYGIRGTGVPPGVDLTFDVTRILLTAKTSTAVDLAKFCDIAALTNGLTVRKRDGETINLFNVKSNAGLKAVAYDWVPYSATKPNEGQDGMGCRLTFAGQNKMGVAVRLPLGDDLEVVIADDLSLILELSIVAEGHLTNPY